MTVNVNIGAYRQTVTLTRKLSPVGDNDGSYTQGTTPLNPATWRCAVARATTSNSNRHFSESVIAVATHVMEGRFHPDIDTLTVVAWTDRSGGNHLANVIDAVDVEGAGVRTILLAVEQANPPLV